MLRPVLILLAIAAPASSAASDLRLATLFEEKVESASVEKQLVESLTQRGFTLIDAAQTRALRAEADPETILDGTSGPVTTADADLIVAGVVEGRVFQPMGLAIHGCQMQATVRLIAADTGEVVHATSLQILERDMTPEGATFHASRKMATQIAQRINRFLDETHGHRYEFLVSTADRVDVRLIEKARAAVANLKGVVSTRVVHTESNRIELEVRTQEVTTRDLALELSEKGVGLFVWGYSNRSVRAELIVQDLLPLTLGVQHFDHDKKDKKRNAWRSSAVPQSIALAFADHTVVDLATPPRLLPRGMLQTKDFEAAGLVRANTLVLRGRYRQRGDRIVITAQIRSPNGKKTITGGSRTCDPDTLTSCAFELGRELSGKLRAAIQRNLRHVELPDPPSVPKPIGVDRVTLSDVFPTVLLSSSSRSKEHVVVTNRGRQKVTGLSLRPKLLGFVEAAVPTAAIDVPPGATVEIPLRLVLDRRRIEKHDRNRPAVLEIGATYEVDDFVVTDTFWRPVTLYHRNALDWRVPRSVGAFVDPASDVVQAVAKAAIASIPRDRASPLSSSVALFSAMAGLRYTKDPVNPYGAAHVDFLQFPDETLARGAGDCDDLAVTYAAMNEAIGVPAVLVMTPGHIFAAVPTHLPARVSTSIEEAEALEMIPHAGRWWIPVETTDVQERFEIAWRNGARTYAAAARRNKARIISVRSLWSDFKPTNLASSDLAASLSALDGDVLGQSITTLSTRVTGRLERLLRQIDTAMKKRPESTGLLNRRGVALVPLGRLDEARTSFERGAAADASSPRPMNNLGNLALLSGQPRVALKRYERALALTKATSFARQFIVLNRLAAAWSIDPRGSPFVELVVEADEKDLATFYELIRSGPPAGGSREAQLDVGHLVRWL